MLIPHPFIGLKLARIQAEKMLFPLLNPQRKKGKARKIHQLSIRITDICNLRCHTCGQWGENGYLRDKNLASLREAEVSGARYRTLFTDLVAHGHRPNLYLWGGEPTMYQDLREVLDSASAYNLPTSIVTNGHQLKSYAEAFKQAGLYLLQLSIDGHNHQLHNRLRPAVGSADAFSQILAGLEALKELRQGRTQLPIVASLSVISKENIGHLVDIYETFKSSVDIFVFYLSWWIDEERALDHEHDFTKRFGFKPKLHRGWIGGWKPNEYEMLKEQMAELRARSHALKSTAPAVTFIPDFRTGEELRRYYTDHSETFGYSECRSIFQAVEINSNGDMSPCRDYHDYVVGNVKEQTIHELWNSERYLEFRQSLQREGLMPVCSRCCGLMGY